MGERSPEGRPGTEPVVTGYHARIRQLKRQAAIDAAFALFVEVGFAETTLQQIAARAGISTATLFKRFPSKAALFEAIVLEVWTLEPPLAGRPVPGDVETGLRAIGREVAARIRDERMLGLYRVFIASIGQFPELGRVMLERGKLPFVGRVEALLAKAEPFPGADAADLPAVAAQFVAMIADRLFWPRVMVRDLALSDAENDAAVDQAVRTSLARLRWDAGSR